MVSDESRAVSPETEAALKIPHGPASGLIVGDGRGNYLADFFCVLYDKNAIFDAPDRPIIPFQFFKKTLAQIFK